MKFSTSDVLLFVAIWGFVIVGRLEIEIRRLTRELQDRGPVRKGMR